MFQIWNHRRTRKCPSSKGNILMHNNTGFQTDDAKLAEELGRYVGVSVKEIVTPTENLKMGALRKKVKELGLKQKSSMKKADLVALIANA